MPDDPRCGAPAILKAPSVPNWCVKFAVSIPHRLAGRWRASLYGIELLELLPFETHRSRRLSKARHFQLLRGGFKKPRLIVGEYSSRSRKRPISR
ncbi:hypothetical protein, partial [Caballeronia humi]|uniref:hypothetical protein n=1 Tax=Caballeronia humi TaxID=326474 RepID=UPI001F1FFFCD